MCIRDRLKIELLVKRAIIPLVNFIKWPIVWVLWAMLFSWFFALGLLWKTWFSVLIVVWVLVYSVWYFWAQYVNWINKWSIESHDLLWIQIVDLNNKKLTKKLILKRLFFFVLLLVWPLLISVLLSMFVWSAAWSIWFLLYLGLFVYNLYLFWTKEDWQLLHDKLAGTKVIYKN